MTALRDTAWAKVNLTLEVRGRRGADGFHEIESVVAFASLGDTVELAPGSALDLVVEGPFATALAGDNLIVQAAKAVTTLKPGARLGRFRLVKLLPVAAGLGGGSADAAAALRLMDRANPGLLADDRIAALAEGLGSDVKVCLSSQPALICSRGEKVAPLRGFPACGVLLVNPGVSLSTSTVYATLGAAALDAAPASGIEPPDFGGDFDRLVRYASPRCNDLQAPAQHLAPQIGAVLAALGGLEGVRLPRMSGSGPTCYGLFASPVEAHRAAGSLATAHPAWWIAAGSLGEPVPPGF